MPAFVTRNLNGNSTLMRQLQDAAMVEIQRTAQVVADQAATIADQIVSKTYVTDRTGDRRRPGRHLLGSFYGKVEIQNGQVRIVLRSRAPSVKVNSLNYGSAPHIIVGGPLAFPRTEGVFGTRHEAARRSRRSQSFSRNQVVTDVVAHPGTQGTHFMETALERAVSAAYHKAVRIPR